MKIEEKAKAYDEAIERARKIHNEQKAQPFDVMLKVFPSLKESEDERIRKAIYNCVKWFGFDSCFFKDVSQEECLAWIEKQGNLVKYYEDKLDRCACENFNKGYKKALEKQGEQKPLFKEGDTVIWDGEEFNILDVTKDSYNVGGYIIPIYRQNELSLKQNSAWNEEDEKMLSNIIDCIKNLPIFYESININGEDKTTERFICDAINWFKSLKERYTWKPSGEQMELIKDIVFKDRQKITRKELSIFHSIYNDLKKLKGE